MINLELCKRYYSSFLNNFSAIIESMNRYHIRLLWISAIFYRIVLDLFYIFAVSYEYSYAGLVFNANAVKYVFSWVLYLLIFVAMPKKENSISSFCIHLQFVIIVAPMLVYYSLNNQSSIYILIVTFAVLLQCWVLRENKKRRSGIYIPNLQSYVTVYSVIFIFICLAIIFVWNGFYGFKAFDFGFLYSIRENSTYPPVLPYFLGWITSVFIPFFLAYGLLRKNYILAISLMFSCLILYMIQGNKIIYLSLFVVIGIYVIAKIKIPLKALYIGFLALCLIVLILFLLEKTSSNNRISAIITTFFGIRFLFIPAQIKFLYYDCFSEYPKVLFSDGQIGHFFGLAYPYNGSIGQTVFAYQQGGQLFGSNSNTGYLGDAYAQLGIYGVILFAVLLALIIKFIDSCSDKKYLPVFLAALSMQIVYLNDGAFLTTLLSGGLFIIILFAMIYQDSKPLYCDRGDL